MALEYLVDARVANSDATPVVFNPTYACNGVLKSVVGTQEVSDNADIGSTYRLARVRSDWRIDSIRVFCDTITAAAADIGLYKTARDGGAVVDADLFASAQSIATPSLVGIETRHEAGVAVFADIAKLDKRIWELLNLSADPLLWYDLTLTLTIAATDPGTIAVKVNYVGGE